MTPNHTNGEPIVKRDGGFERGRKSALSKTERVRPPGRSGVRRERERTIDAYEAMTRRAAGKPLDDDGEWMTLDEEEE